MNSKIQLLQLLLPTKFNYYFQQTENRNLVEWFYNDLVEASVLINLAVHPLIPEKIVEVLENRSLL